MTSENDKGTGSVGKPAVTEVIIDAKALLEKDMALYNPIDALQFYNDVISGVPFNFFKVPTGQPVRKRKRVIKKNIIAPSTAPVTSPILTTHNISASTTTTTAGSNTLNKSVAGQSVLNPKNTQATSSSTNFMPSIRPMPGLSPLINPPTSPNPSVAGYQNENKI